MGTTKPIRNLLCELLLIFLRSTFGTLCFMSGLILHAMVLAGRLACRAFPPLYQRLYKAADECQPFGETPKR